MIRKLKLWWYNKRHPLPKPPTVVSMNKKSYSYEELKQAYMIGLSDGKQEGLEVAKRAAAKSLGEILRQQNK